MNSIEYKIPEKPQILIEVFGQEKLDNLEINLFNSLYESLSNRIKSYEPSKFLNERQLLVNLLERNFSTCLTKYYELESKRFERLIEKSNISPRQLGKSVKMAELRLVS